LAEKQQLVANPETYHPSESPGLLSRASDALKGFLTSGPEYSDSTNFGLSGTQGVAPASAASPDTGRIQGAADLSNGPIAPLQPPSPQIPGGNISLSSSVSGPVGDYGAPSKYMRDLDAANAAGEVAQKEKSFYEGVANERKAGIHEVAAMELAAKEKAQADFSTELNARKENVFTPEPFLGR
jgi:hypothetical protein